MVARARLGIRATLVLVIASGWLGAAESDVRASWLTVELHDVVTREAFRISDFEGRPVLLESFAVWCPTCTKQQQEIRRLHDEVGEAIVSISLDVDPNEEEALVRRHALQNGFGWRYVVAPPQLTLALIQQFGTAVVVASSAPMILVCPDGGAIELLRRGVKSAEWLLDTIQAKCGAWQRPSATGG